MKVVSDITTLAGLCLVSVAGWMIYPPLGVALVGAGCLAVGLVLARAK